MVMKFSLSNESKKLDSLRQQSNEQNIWTQARKINRRMERVKLWGI